MQEIQLTPTSYIVLGLVAMAGEATPYDLKRLVGVSVGHFWSVPHSALYAEPERLARGGFVREEREETGRRRRRYSLTERGREALDEWVGAPTAEFTELRDLALLKLFFGADRRSLAEAQLDMLRHRLEDYEAMKTADPGTEPRGPWLALEAGIGHVRESIRFWERVLAEARSEQPAERTTAEQVG